MHVSLHCKYAGYVSAKIEQFDNKLGKYEFRSCARHGLRDCIMKRSKHIQKKLLTMAIIVPMIQSIDVMAAPMSNRLCDTILPSYYYQNKSDSTSLIENQVKDIIAKHLKIEKNQIKRDSEFIKDLGADSLDFVEIVVMIEEKYGLNITDDELNSLKKVSDVVNLVEKRKKTIVK